MDCPRCNKETNHLEGAGKGIYDKVLKKQVMVADCYIQKDQLGCICKDCIKEVRSQHKKLVKEDKEREQRQKDRVFFEAIHNLIESKF